jgi:glutamate synthase (ferredoxin)
LIFLSDQVGVLGDVISNAENVVAKGRLGPGQMVVADLETGRFLANEEISKEMATKKPYKEWIKGQLRGLQVSGALAGVTRDE